MPELATAADAEARAAQLAALHAEAAGVAAADGLDPKERGAADDCLAAAAGALLTAWRLEGASCSPRRLLQVRLPTAGYRTGLLPASQSLLAACQHYPKCVICSTQPTTA